MSGLGENFKAFRIIAWHSINLIDGRIRFIPYLDVFKIKELKVALIAESHAFNHPCFAKISNGQMPSKFR